MKSYEELMQELVDTQTRLEAERKSMAAQLQKEREEMLLLAQAERRSQLEAYEAKVEEHKRKKKAEDEAAELRRVQDTAARMAAEQAAAKADEQYRLYHEKLEFVVNAIAEAEFSEEKHRKSLDDAKKTRVVVEDFPAGDEINVEHPVAPLNAEHPGEAVVETGGAVGFDTMSSHLKQILRQAQR
jgi:membrane protein involved in colicin uptake